MENETSDSRLDEIEGIVDEASISDVVAPVRYDITSFGADYDVDGLVKRLNRGDIFIPPFQRDYVWNLKDASRFIESLLLGLPVPGVFLAREPDTNRLLVIDGQQRLKSLQFFYNGYFNPKDEDKSKRIFRLKDVQPQFADRSYEELDEKHRIQLDNSVIHATVIKQDSPADDDTSIYHVFERLNTGGRKLVPQEIRLAIYHGSLITHLEELNSCPAWRSLYGPVSSRLKDQELILRFLALYSDANRYEKPLAEFLNKFAQKNRQASTEQLSTWSEKFLNTITVIHEALGKEAFRKGRSLNTAMYDSVIVGLARRLDRGPVTDFPALVAAHQALLANPDYQSAIEKATSDETNVALRIRRATEAFAEVI